MPAPLKVVPHLSNAEIEARYRAAPDATLSRHWQVVLLVARGEGVATAAKVTTLSVPWVRRIVQRYHQDGPAGLGDHRHNNPGATSPLPAEVITELREALAGDAPDGGVWSGPKAAFKSRLGDKVKEVQAAHPGAKVTLCSMDEHRVGLKPILRRVWTRKGTHPIALGWHRFKPSPTPSALEQSTASLSSSTARAGTHRRSSSLPTASTSTTCHPTHPSCNPPKG